VQPLRDLPNFLRPLVVSRLTAPAGDHFLQDGTFDHHN
jgi:hypothetical protein